MLSFSFAHCQDLKFRLILFFIIPKIHQKIRWWGGEVKSMGTLNIVVKKRIRKIVKMILNKIMFFLCSV